jgi:conjugative relaxase-like TrwC/TraI family protein
VVADIAKLSVGREAYYTRELATDHQQYLSGHGESPGRWYGAGATALGLEGEASPAGFQAMFEGRDPTTGELLGRRYGRNAVPAFDVVLRPTKSVSILYGLGDPATGRAVLAAHHAGLAEAVGYLDEHIGARRGHGGVQHVSGQGLLAVGFDHRTSREGDPLLHTHLVIANRVQGPDGRWTALDGRDVYRHRLASDAIYRATYQRTLSRTLGVEWTAADTHGNRELQGMPEELVRGFSKRTDQIDAELDRLRADGRERTPRLVKWTVHATRKPKQHERPDTLVREVTGRTPDRDLDRTVSAEAVGRLFDRLVGPEPQGAGELDLPDWEQPDGYLQLAQALSRAGGQALAIDTPSSPDLQRLSTSELRAERDQLRRQLDQAPRDRARELARATTHRHQAEQVLAAHQPSAGGQPAGMLGWLRRGDQPAGMPGGLAVATQQANRAHDRERELRQHQQRHDGWLEANAHLGPQYRQVVRTLAWQRRATGLAVEAERPGYVLEALGPVPESTRGRRAWRHAAAEIEQYRHTYQITNPEQALGPEPRDPGQRADRQRARTAIARVHTKQRTTDRAHERQPTSERTSQPRPRQPLGRQGPERAAG